MQIYTTTQTHNTVSHGSSAAKTILTFIKFTTATMQSISWSFLV